MRILQAAAELMLARGGDAVTVDEVAERAGVGKATVYRRFPSKDEMAARALRSLFVTHVEVPDTGSLRGDLRSTYAALIRFAGSTQGRSFLRLTAGTAVRSDRVAAMYRSAYEARRARFTAMLTRAVHRGELGSTADAEPLLDALPSLLMLRTVAGMPLPTESEVDQLLDLHLDGATRRAPGGG